MANRTRHAIQHLIRRIAATQYGLITREQLLALDLSRDAVRRRVRSGLLERVLPTVYRVAGAPTSWEQELMGACLWRPAQRAICGPPAAALWGIGRIPREGVELAVVGGVKAHGLPFRVRRFDHNLLPDIAHLQGLAVTSVRRTILDLAGEKHPRTERALDDALFRKLTSLGRLWTLYDDEWTRGRRGIAILRNLLVDRAHGSGPTQTDLEDLFLRIARDFHLPRPRLQYEIRVQGEDVRVDFAYPEAKIVIECDSYAWHMDRPAFERDRERDLLLMSAGWLVLRFTWAKLRYEPVFVAETVRRHYEARAAA